MSFRQLTDSEKEQVEKRTGIKDAMLMYEDGAATILSGKCWFCRKQWKYELEVAVRDKGVLTGRWEKVYVCEECRKEHEPMWGSDRIRELHKR